MFPGLTPESGKFANKLADIDHLVGHKLSRRDVFVTDDKGILRRYSQLRDGVGIIVMTPAEALRYVDAHHARLHTRSLEPVPDDSIFRDRGIKGAVVFEYSSNNGRFLIGEGINLFETRWSSASERAIHAYKWPPTVAGIALALAEALKGGCWSAAGMSTGMSTHLTRQYMVALDTLGGG